jgi:hypothetical protein
VQSIVAMLVLGPTRLDRPVSKLSPWLDQVIRPIDEVIADLEAMTHRRFIKTHTPLDGLPQHDDVTYVCVLPDPRDAAVSWGNHARNLDWDRMAELRAAAHGTNDLHELPSRPEPSPDPVERWWAYVSARATSPEFASNLELLARHAEEAWARRDDPNVVLAHDADLEADLAGERYQQVVRELIQDEELLSWLHRP